MKIRLLIGLYGLLILGETVFPGLWPDALTYLPPVAFWLPPVFLILFALKSRERQYLAWGCAVAAQVILTSPFGVSLATFESSNSKSFTMVTWNMKHGWQGAEDVVEYLGQSPPDIILLQEAQENLAIRLLTEKIPDYHLVRSLETDNDVAVFTRFPIQKQEPLPDFPGFNLLATVQIGQENVNLVNLHLDKASKSKIPVRSIWSTTTLHAEAREELLNHLGKTKGPIIVAGDFNAPSAAPVLRRLPLQEVRGLGLEATFPDAFPLWRLDHILINNQLRVNSCWVDPVSFSDHRPVWARLSFR